jgi:hypothetical protein
MLALLEFGNALLDVAGFTLLPRVAHERPDGARLRRLPVSGDRDVKFCMRSTTPTFDSGRAFANELDFQLQLEAWFDERPNARHHRTLRCRPSDRLIEERPVMTALRTFGRRRIEARVTDRDILAIVLDTGEIACRAMRRPGEGRSLSESDSRA